LSGAQQSRTAFTKVLDERLNEERVEFGDHGAVLGVGFVLYTNPLAIYIYIYIYIKERVSKGKLPTTWHGVSLLPRPPHSTQ
jgi:hypothetical protein